jgi:hypothetical protein
LNYYKPMLAFDRDAINDNWQVMSECKWVPKDAPNSTYSRNLDGLELTLWMIDDFTHQMSTDSFVDRGLAEFNKARRAKVVFPSGWGRMKYEKPIS